MKEIFSFLNDLNAHNDREWMHENKKRYEGVRKSFNQFIESLIAGISEFDEGIAGLQPKDCVFRINRDIRFSKDKRPYKTNFGAAMTEGGKKSPNPTYYIHVEPGKSMVACGIYMPEADILKKIRQEVDYNAQELKKIIENKTFMETFGGIRGEQLKTAPKGYPKDHPNIDLLRFKSFIVWKELSDDFFFDDNLNERLLSQFKVGRPFNEYLSVAIS